MNSFQTISGTCEVLFKEKGSKFLGFAFHVSNTKEIQKQLDALRQIHPKATHHCYAWRLGLDQLQYRVNDDGEPSGTAGKPILGQIDSFSLTDCLVIVVRYYGGTPLGASGLIQAYKETAKLALQSVEIVTVTIKVNYKICCDYTHLQKAYHWIQTYKGVISGQEMMEECIIYFSIEKEFETQFLAQSDSFYPLEAIRIE